MQINKIIAIYLFIGVVGIRKLEKPVVTEKKNRLNIITSTGRKFKKYFVKKNPAFCSYANGDSNEKTMAKNITISPNLMMLLIVI